jgi:XTP/dITP diphosphohydrolase
VIASHNEGKVHELGQLFEPYGIECVSAGSLDLPEPAETQDTFEGNALLKARTAAAGSGLIALADDSGLEIEALGGAPGVHSARWGGTDRDFD